jgi:ATP-dependent Clp protease adaptor protein ClpS
MSKGKDKSEKPKNHIEVDVSMLTPEELRSLVDAIYSEFPGVEFHPETPLGELASGIESMLTAEQLEQASQSAAQKPQTATRERSQTQIQYPTRYKVIFMNDDFTPMDFVIQLLVEIFNKSIDDAHLITMEIHNTGSGIAGVYSLEVAEQKTHEALIMCKHVGHPLEIVYEPA